MTLASEALVQSKVRLEAARTPGVTLFRNNVGAYRDDSGRVVRYGLANDSAQLNQALKSADLIGWRSVVITPDMVGRIVAIFLSRECKAEGWTPGASERERAQQAWADMINQAGGDARFCTGEGTL